MRSIRFRKFAVDRNGSTAIEYAILAAGIGVTLAMTVSLLGDRMVTTYGNIADAIFVADAGPDEPPACSKKCNEKKAKKDKKKKS